MTGVTYGAIVAVDGVQGVVCTTSAPWQVRVTGTCSVRAVLESELVALARPKGVQACAGCGDVWKVHGDRTSHCTGCHQTFEGGVLWDAHRIDLAGGGRGCKAAASMIFRGSRLRKVADSVSGLVLSGTWRGPGVVRDRFDGDAA